jgi:hypothetical protein
MELMVRPVKIRWIDRGNYLFNSIRYGNVRLIIFVQEDICGHISFLIEDLDSIHAAGVNGNYAKVKLPRFDADQRGTGYPNP